MDLEEVWVEVDNYPNYVASNYGEIISRKTGKKLKQRPNQDGSLRVVLSHEGRLRQVYVTRLIAQLFHPHYRDGAVVKNVNGDKTDNKVTNIHVRAHDPAPPKRYRQETWGKRVQIVESGMVFKSIRDCARYVGGDYSSVYKCLRGERDSHMGYTYRYYEEDSERTDP